MGFEQEKAGLMPWNTAGREGTLRGGAADWPAYRQLHRAPSLVRKSMDRKRFRSRPSPRLELHLAVVPDGGGQRPASAQEEGYVPAQRGIESHNAKGAKDQTQSSEGGW